MKSVYSPQSAITLIEVLVTLIVLTIGLLAMAAAQLSGLRNIHHAYFRTQATVLAHEIIDSIRANPLVAQSADGYSLDANEKLPGEEAELLNTCFRSRCTPIELAKADLAQWYRRLRTILPRSSARIYKKDDRFTVETYWNVKNIGQPPAGCKAAIDNGTGCAAFSFKP